jgi:arsenical pump membrane protein
MGFPWLVAIGVEYLVLRRYFAADLPACGSSPTRTDAPGAPPWAAITAVGATLAGFVVASAVGVNPAWAAAAGALALTVHAAIRRRTTVKAVVRAFDIPFLIFVLALAVLVRSVIDNGLDHALRDSLPHSSGLIGLLEIAAVAAVAANVVNNLPAVLMLLPLVAPTGHAAVLAVLIGVNIGPNLSYTGSLATMLWRRVMHQHNHRTNFVEFTKVGLLATPAALVAAVTALWASLRLLGG